MSLTVEEIPALMLSYLTNGYTMQQILDDIYDKVHMPVMILNLNNHVILYTKCKAASRIWGFAVKRGCIPKSFVSGQTSPQGRLFTMYQSLEAVSFAAGEIDEYFHVCMPVRAIGELDGYLTVRFCAREQQAFAVALVKALAQVYQYRSDAKSEREERGDPYMQTYFARELLLYDRSEESCFFDSIYGLTGLTRDHPAPYFDAKYAIAAMRATDQSRPMGQLRAADVALRQGVPRSLSIISKNILLVLLYGLDDRPGRDQPRMVSQLEQFAQKYHLHCGVSVAFSSLHQRKYYKRQAMAALTIGPRQTPDGHLFSADTLFGPIILYEAISRLGKQILNLSDIELLAAHDETNNTVYLQTLQAYLENGNRLAAASAKMYVDRGTMKYRLNKIHELLRADLDDPATATRLYFGIQVFMCGTV